MNDWTHTPPETPGWYWVSVAGSEPIPAHVTQDRMVEFSIHSFRIGEIPLFQREIQWSVDPIIPPKLP
jgi:hypothetical protein